ncbi:uncharacterized protein [Antennarius striatus]|uniref:uncharacterized protein isoform X2 n=1 Tax=Antennarius striatus TaxID=241820 RepID=UPI0035AF34B9
MNIPVIDFGAYSLDEEEVPEEPMHDLRQQFKTALTEVGFVFLKNTGITQEEMDRVLDVSLKFFQQPDELKRPFCWKNFDSPGHGWVFPEEERLSPLRPPDLKESFNIGFLQPDIKWPQGEFREVLTSFFHRSKELSLRVLTVMAHSLDLDPEVFLSAHRSVGMKNNATALRTLYYPPVGQEVKEGQMRCGEHSDYGTISLLFHNNEGLQSLVPVQVRARSGEYIDVPVSPGYILINIADLMQRWTNDQFTSAVFADLLDAVIKERHNGYDPRTMTHPTDLDASKLQSGQFDERYVLSSRVRTGRSIRGLSLPPACTRAERREVERVVVDALAGLKDDLAGRYYSLTLMTDEEQQQLIDDHFLFDKPVSPLLTCAGMARDWPDARGIWWSI